jgi:endoribonuclease Dicer
MSFSGIRKTHAGSEPRLSPSNLTQSSIVYPELTLALATRSTDAVISELQRGHASSHNLPVREDNEGKIKKHQILEIGALEELEDTECEEDSEPAASKPQKLTERKRIQRAKFDSYIEGYLKIQASNSAIVLDDDRTTEWLVRQAESEHIIASPRDYQVELFEKAKEKNLIAVLDTGESTA